MSTLFERLDTFFKNLSSPAGATHDEHDLRLAIAALLLEVMQVDDNEHPEERQAVIDALEYHFQLAPNEIHALLEEASRQQEQASDYHRFTRLINQQLDAEQKARLLEQLWRVAYADRRLDKYEEHLIRKLADLLHIPHQVFITRKHRVQNKPNN